MKIWFPTIRAGTGADIFIINLAKGLKEKGIETEITWFPHLAEILPHPLKYIKAPKNVDLIHSNSWYGFAFSNINIPTVISAYHWVHDLALSPYKSKAQKIYHAHLIRRYENVSIENADAVVAISKYTGNILSENFPDKKIHIINTGIDTNLFRPKNNNKTRNDKFKLLFVGSCSKRKGFDLLSPIIKMLPETITLNYTEGEIKNISQVNKLGKLNLKELIKNYQDCDALIFPTRYEGFGYVVAEAMACAKPVVSTNCTAIPELITNDETGLLCEENDIKSFSKSIMSLYKDKDLCNSLGEAARDKIICEFNIENMINKYINLYKKLL